MPNNKLILRRVTSPYTFPIPDTTKGRVLTWDEVDNNFIFSKGLSIQNGVYDSGTSTINLTRIDGTNIAISGITGGGGTGGTSPAGDPTWVQIANGTEFTASSAFTASTIDGSVSATFTTTTGATVPTLSGSTTHLQLGTLDDVTGGIFDNIGFSLSYHNTMSGGTYSGIFGGDLTSISGVGDNVFYAGYFDGFTPSDNTFAMSALPTSISLRGGNTFANSTDITLTDTTANMTITTPTGSAASIDMTNTGTTITGNLNIASSGLTISNVPITLTGATSGGTALPANAGGYIQVVISGNTVAIPYFPIIP